MSFARTALIAGTCSAAVAGAAAAIPLPVDPVCDERAKVVAALEETFGEEHQALGLEEVSGQLVEIWVSAETGTWTILMTQPDGTSCLAASGSNWMEAPGGVEGVRAFP